MEGRFIIPNYEVLNAGVFIIEKWKKKNWLAEIGARYDHQRIDIYKYEYSSTGNYVLTIPVLVFNNTSFNTGLSYTEGTTWSVNLALGMTWRPPSVNELNSNGLHHGTVAIEKGDTSLTAETTYNISTQLHYQYRDLHLDANPLIHSITNDIYRQPDANRAITFQGAFLSLQYHQANALL